MAQSSFMDYLGYEIPSAFLEYSVIRRKFYDLAWIVYGQFKTDYSKNFPNIDVLMDKGTDVTIEYLKPVVRHAVEELVRIGIYDVDIDYFIEQYVPRYFEWDNAYNTIFEKYAKICMDESEARQFREERKNNRARWGTITTSDNYIGSQLSTGLFNLYDGIGHSVRNAIGNAISKSIANSEKKALFAEPNTFYTLTESIWNTCFYLHFALIDALNDNREIKLPDYEHFASVAPTTKRMLENLNNKLIPTSDIDQVIVNRLKSNPFEFGLYGYLLESGRFPLSKITEMADVVSLDISHLYFGSSTNELLYNMNSYTIEEKEELYLSLKGQERSGTRYDDDRVKLMNQCLMYEGNKYNNFEEIKLLINPPAPTSTPQIQSYSATTVGSNQTSNNNGTNALRSNVSHPAIVEKLGCGYTILAVTMPWLGIIIHFVWKGKADKEVIAKKILKLSLLIIVIYIVVIVMFALVGGA